MIDSVGSSMAFRPPPPSGDKNVSLSDEQTSLIEDTLSQYDADNLSQEDATAIAETFAEAGIPPGKEFANALSASGFDAREIGELAGVGEKGGPGGQGPGGPPPPQSGGTESSSLDLSSIMSYLDELSESDDGSTSDFMANISERFGLSEGQSLISVMA